MDSPGVMPGESPETTSGPGLSACPMMGYPRWERSAMPREYVSQPDEPFDVVIGWGNSQDEVQVATVCDGVPTGPQRIVNLLNEYLTEAGMPTVDYDELCNRVKHRPHFDGWYVGLKNRRAVNDLIRLLQRARDGAFGKDA